MDPSSYLILTQEHQGAEAAVQSNGGNKQANSSSNGDISSPLLQIEERNQYLQSRRYDDGRAGKCFVLNDTKQTNNIKGWLSLCFKRNGPMHQYISTRRNLGKCKSFLNGRIIIGPHV